VRKRSRVIERRLPERRRQLVEPRTGKPDLERGDGLVHQHVDAIGRGEPALADRPDQRRFAGGPAIHEIGDGAPGCEQRRVEGQAVVLEPDRRAMHHDGRFLEGAPCLGRIEPRGLRARPDCLRQRARPLRGAVQDGEGLRVLREGERGRAGRPAGADHHGAPGRVDAPGAQGAQEPGCVGVVADEGLAVTRHAAHRADAPRARMETVDEAGDGGLVRHRHVEPVGAQRAQSLHCAHQVLGGDPARTVRSVHPEQREGARVDGRRARMRHRIAEEDEELAHQSTSSTSAPSERRRSKNPGTTRRPFGAGDDAGRVGRQRRDGERERDCGGRARSRSRRRGAGGLRRLR